MGIHPEPQATDEGLMQAKHRTMPCRLPACPHPPAYGGTFPAGEGLNTAEQTTHLRLPFEKRLI